MVHLAFLMAGLPVAVVVAAVSAMTYSKEISGRAKSIWHYVIPPRDFFGLYFVTLALCLVMTQLVLLVPQPELKHNPVMLRYAGLFVQYVFLALLMGIVFPARLWVIPKEFTHAGLIAAPFLALFIPGVFGIFQPTHLPVFIKSLVHCVFGGAVGFGLTYGLDRFSLHFFKRPGMGFGTIKHFALIGAFLGPSKVLLCIMLFSLVTSFDGLFLLPLRRAVWTTFWEERAKIKEVPTGVLTSFSAVIVYALGDPAIQLYLNRHSAG